MREVSKTQNTLPPSITYSRLEIAARRLEEIECPIYLGGVHNFICVFNKFVKEEEVVKNGLVRIQGNRAHINIKHRHGKDKVPTDVEIYLLDDLAKVHDTKTIIDDVYLEDLPSLNNVQADALLHDINYVISSTPTKLRWDGKTNS